MLRTKYVYGLIGKEIDYSFSRNYFNQKFKKEGLIHNSYKNFDCENLHQVLKTLKQKRRTIGKEDRIFTYRKGEKYFNIKSSDVNKYLKQFGKFTAKDFKTWVANIELKK